MHASESTQPAQRPHLIHATPYATTPTPGLYPSPLLQIPAADLLGEATLAAEHSMDLFALGILAYEVMTGKRFYGGEP